MYRAKRRGGARYELHDADLATEAERRQRLEHELRTALERRELVLHYQPKVELRAGRIARMEALVRWQHPERGLLLPAEFIGLAEETGLIVPLGRWVLETAYAQAAEWQYRYPDDPPLAVCANVSAREFWETGWVEQVEGVLRATGLDPRGAQLELTESVLAEDLEVVGATLGRLKRLGVQLSIDDFGMGYSGLNSLRHLPLDILKLDKSFVAGMVEDARDLAIVRAAIALADALGLQTQAEGIETADQAKVLLELGCEVGQGYFFSPPLPAETATELLGRRLAS
jgi:EAL domain-containing protein (putative c-di-GMP-specific phosphodiesterase class I)